MDSENHHDTIWPTSQAMDTNNLKMEVASSDNGMMNTVQSAQHLHQQQQQQTHQHQDQTLQTQLQDHAHTVMSYTQPPQSQAQPQSQQPPLQQQQPQAPPPPPSHQDSLDRQMIRHLLNRYSLDEISKLMQEESSSPAMRTTPCPDFEAIRLANMWCR